MQLDSDSLSLFATTGTCVAALAVAVAAARRVRWRTLASQQPEFHRWAVCAISLMVLWSIRTDVPGAPGLHILGVTAVTLVLGLWPAVMVTLLAQAVTGVLGGDIAGIPINWLASSVIPIVVTEAWRRLVLKLLPADPFAFIFGSAFFGSALAVSAASLATLLFGPPAAFGQGAVPSWGGFFLLVAFPEAFINGAIVTLLVVQHPDHLAGYDAAYRVRRQV